MNQFEEVVKQWTPKIEKISRLDWGIPSFDFADICQEVTIVLWRCWQTYDKGIAKRRALLRGGRTRPASFHTYFHSAAYRRMYTISSEVRRHNVFEFSMDDLESKFIYEMEPTIGEELALLGLTVEEEYVVESKTLGFTSRQIGGDGEYLSPWAIRKLVTSAKIKLTDRWRK